MRTIATVLTAMLALALGVFAFGQETTIKVPQGSGVLPTVGQVNCLEEMGSGRLCAATYECSGESGRLWGDLANHDGRRAIGVDSPVARGRDCTVTVDGRAAVRWLTGYSPGGRDGELVGLTTSADALRPVLRVERQGGEGGGSLLAYILNRYDATLRDYVDEQCSHIRPSHQEHANCVDSVLGQVIAPKIDLPENAFTRCMVDAIERSHCDRATCNVAFLFKYWHHYSVLDVNRAPHEGEHYRQCLPQAREILADHGLEYYTIEGYAGWFIRFRE